jgi:4-hydroxy-tetrahydrodipicolinate synthase
MTNIENFSWLWTALITPFDEKWNVDFEAFDNLIEIQVSSWVKWILFLWSTWESSTLTKTEKLQIVKRWIKKIQGKCFVMVNSWTNSTQQSIDFTLELDQIHWIDAFLLVNPYYNKPTQEWLYRHFKAIADSTSKRIFIYNIQWRTWVNLETETLVRLSRSCYNVIWVKEASWNLDQMQEVLNKTKEDFVVLSWDDSKTFDLIKMWGHWLISVASNFFPKIMVEMVEKALKQDFESAEKINKNLSKFFEWEFIQTNPLPIKAALAEVWLIKEIYRLPLCEMDIDLRFKWVNILHKYSEYN